MGTRGDRGSNPHNKAVARDRASAAGGEVSVSMPSMDSNAGSNVRVTGAERALLASIIEDKIIPQLINIPGRVPATPPIDDGTVLAMADAAIANEQAVIEQHVIAAVARGMDPSDAMAEIVTRTARQLGVDWETDRRDFFDVTVGLGTLQRVVSHLNDVPGVTLRHDRAALLGSLPGETHTFGLAVVSHYFQQARWPVDFRPYAEFHELKAAAAHGWFTFVGLSIANRDTCEMARTLIAQLRSTALNPSMRVILGGAAVLESPEIAADVGADGFARDGREAVQTANAWADAMPRPRPQ